MLSVFPIDKNNVWTGEELIQDEKAPLQGVPEAPPVLTGDQVAWRAGKNWLVLEQYPTPALAVPDVETIWLAIKEIRDQKAETGGYLVGLHWFHSDIRSRSQQQGLARMADRVEAAGGPMNQPFEITPGQPLMWKTMSGEFVPMTPNLAHDIFAAAAMQDAAIFTHAEILNAQMRAAGDPNTIDITAGWPAVYGDS